MQKSQKDQHADTVSNNTDGSQDVRNPRISQTHTECTYT